MNGRAKTVGGRTNRLRECESKNWEKLLLVTVVVFPLLLSNGCAGFVSGQNASQNSSQAAFQMSPASVNFGKVPVGKQTSQSVSVTNTGKSALNITQATLSNTQFSMSGMTVPMALAAGQSGNISVSVNPATAGSLSGTLTVQGDSGTSPVAVSLSATGVSPQPQISLSSSSVDFGTVGTGSQGTASVVVSNTGGADLIISVITVNGTDFAVSGVTTPKTISAGQSASMSLAFHPAAAGAVTGSITITSNDPVTPASTISLAGTGSATPIGQLSATPSSLSFGGIAIGSNATQQITLNNTGNGTTHISAVTISGTGFSVTGVTLPAAINASGNLALTIAFTPSATGSVTGTLLITSDANGSPLKIALSGSGVQAGLSVTPSTFNFGSVADGQTKSQAFTVTNTGSATLTIGQLTVSGAGYSASGLVTPASLAAGQSASFSAEFAPTTAGALTGSISIASNAPNSPATVALNGTGVTASVTMTPSPTSVSFGSINAGSSNAQNVTLTNTGNSSLIISQIAVSAKDVNASGITTPLTLGAGQKTTLTLTFAPKSSESVTGNVTVSSSQGASAVIPVNGSGVKPAFSVTPSSVSFGNVSLGSSNSQTVKVSNSGTGVLTISQVSVTGSGFNTSGLTLPISLTAGQSSTFNLQFAPTTVAPVTGSASIVSNAPGSPGIIALSGTGIASTQTLSFSTTTVGFGSVNTGSSSTQSVTVTNTGNSSVTIFQITPSGAGFSLNGAGTPVTLASSQALTFGILFTPASAGSVSGSVTVTSNASGSPVAIALSGTGVASTAHSVALTWNASTSTVSGYNVYRTTTSGSGYVLINGGLVSSLNYSDNSVQSGTTYYYVTTAVDSSGDESAYSNQVQAAIP
jgi:hypothetical protein